MPMHILGLSGMPRRVLDYPEIYSTLNAFETFGHSISIFSLVCFFSSLTYGYYSAYITK